MLKVTADDVFDGARFFRRWSIAEYLVTRLMTGLMIDESPRVSHKYRAERQGILMAAFTGDAEQIARGLNLRKCQSDVEVMRSADYGDNHLVHAKIKGQHVGIKFLNYHTLADEGIAPIIKGVTYDDDGSVSPIRHSLATLYFESVWGTEVKLLPVPSGGWVVVA